MNETRTPHQQRVDEFMHLAKQELPEKPTMPDEKTRRLRAKLILEEALETVIELGFDVWTHEELVKKGLGCLDLEPNGKENLEGIADGCCDLIVVTTGTLSSAGLSDMALQREVDCNNLAKFEHRCPQCDRVLKPNSMPVNEETGRVPGERRCLCCETVWMSGHHNEAGKWIKPENHKGPRIAEVLRDQGGEL